MAATTRTIEQDSVLETEFLIMVGAMAGGHTISFHSVRILLGVVVGLQREKRLSTRTMRSRNVLLLPILFPLVSGPKYSLHFFLRPGSNSHAIHVDYVDFVPELGWRFRSRNLIE